MCCRGEMRLSLDVAAMKEAPSSAQELMHDSYQGENIN